MGGGVSGMIRKAAGSTIFNDIKKHIPAKLGDVIVTGAGELLSSIYMIVTTRCPSGTSFLFLRK